MRDNYKIFYIQGGYNNEQDKKDLQIAAKWAISWLNNNGGDFELVKLESRQATIENETACPCFDSHQESGNIIKCIGMEKIINESIQIDNPNLCAGFIECSCHNDSKCTLVINLDRWLE